MRNADIRTIENFAYDSSILDIRWRVTTLCNYDCRFCIQGNREKHLRQSRGESPELRKQICEKVVGLIESQKHYRSIKVGLIGGEVTILKDFPEILEALSGSCFRGEVKFYLTTNFSAGADYFRRLCDIIQGAEYERKLHISASFYPEYTSREAFAGKLREIDAYVRKKQSRRSLMDAILGKKRERRVNLSAGIPILNDADYSGFLDMRTAFEDTCIGIKPIVIRKYHTDLSEQTAKALLQNEQKTIRVSGVNGEEHCFQNIQALGMALEDRDSFCPAGYLCDAGIHNIWVDAFGNVMRCPAIGSTMELGNIINGSFRLLEAPDICTSDHCSCSQFGRIEKKKRDIR